MKKLEILTKIGLFELFCGAGQKNGNRIRIPWVRLPPDMGRIFSRKFFPNFKKFQQIKRGGKIGNPKESGSQFFKYVPTSVKSTSPGVTFNAESDSDVHFHVMRHLTSLFDADV